MRMCRGGGAGTSYFYMNSRNKFNTKGLGFGGRMDVFRLFVDEDFVTAKMTKGCATYGTEPFVPFAEEEYLKELKIASIEVWAISGMEAKEQQFHLLQKDAEKRAERRDGMVQNEFDKEMFFAKTFG